MQNKKKLELLAPAGDLEKLKIAVLYGADAVYIGGEAYGLRAKAKNFDIDTMAEGVRFAHEHGVKVYVTANIFAHNMDFEGMVPREDMAKLLAERFRKSPEQLYGKIMELLLTEDAAE